MNKITQIFATLALLSAQAYADDRQGHQQKKHPCRGQDLDGDYVMYQAAVNKPELNHTGRCEVNVTNGVLAGVCAFDPNVSGNPNFQGEVYGTASINSNCSVDMEIRFHPNPNAPDFAVISSFDLQLTPDKQGFVGKFSNQFGVYGLSNGARYSVNLPHTPAD
ncbi:hypothetical protein [Methylomonas rapida]|uniref:Uncharacterized protein n=1 Tax=Methylomonas rapida TaxID=2963939 RepID=A0ABY7GH12_9GAMM|nr:hypothetical protein [Methylomonas rapida]WAR43450.1 hypothetical protein NM686_013800 [Methylomonas rapida]